MTNSGVASGAQGPLEIVTGNWRPHPFKILDPTWNQ